MGKVKRVISKVVHNPKMIFQYANAYGLLRFLSDERWNKFMWKLKIGKTLNLDNPRGFNEKVIWLKIYDQNPEYIMMVDKYLVREYIAETIGEEYLIPLLGVWENADDIDFDALPDEFVLKCNHNSGEGMCVCKDKSALNVDEVKKNIRKALKRNYYWNAREWSYKYVKPRVICEKFMKDTYTSNLSGTLLDYKFYCFNGEPKFLYVGSNDVSDGYKGEVELSFFDMNWQTPEFYRTDHKPVSFTVEKPSTFDEMVDIARKLSKGIPFIRVDLYCINGKVYFSELTIYPGGGFGLFSPEEWELKIGDWIQLPPKSSYKK